MISMTENAKDKIRLLMNKRQTPEHYLRIALQGGGCSGFKYHYDLVESPDEKDKVFEFDDIKVCIDIKSYLFLSGMEIDYEETIMRTGIVINNPNATRSCGCGESISF